MNTKKRNFCIKETYQIQLNPDYFLDEDNGVTWQEKIYDLAYFLGKRFGKKYIIDIGAGNGQKLRPFVNDFKITAIDFGENLDLLKASIPNQKIIRFDLEKGLPKFNPNTLEDTIIICADVLEHIKDPHQLLKQLAKLSYTCAFLLISTPDRDKYRGEEHNGPSPNPAHIREWSFDEFNRLLNEYRFNRFLVGYSLNCDLLNQKYAIFSLSGKLITANLHEDIFSALSLAEIDMTASNIPKILRRITSRTQLILNYEKELEEYRNQLNRIFSAKTYKAWQFYNHFLKRRLLKNKV
jgi:SAM-dependent methyltransferase